MTHWQKMLMSFISVYVPTLYEKSAKFGKWFSKGQSSVQIATIRAYTFYGKWAFAFLASK